MGKEAGQTMIEYLFLLLAVVFMCLALASRVKLYMLGNTAECPNDSRLCKIVGLINQDFSGNFRYFTLRR